MECAPCAIAGNLQDCLVNENIKLYTCSEVKSIKGFFGNFEVAIQRKAKYIKPELCFGCGICIDACPVEVTNEYEEGLAKRKAVYLPIAGALPNVPVVDREHCIKLQGGECNACEASCGFGAFDWNDHDEMIEQKTGAVIIATGSVLKPGQMMLFGDEDNIPGFLSPMQLERIIAENGPTKGKLVMPNGKEPLSGAFIHCVGREHTGYCSGICCMYSIKLALCLKEKNPSLQITNFYRELCLPKKEHQRMYEQALEHGVQFIQEDNVVNMSSEREQVVMKYYDESRKVHREAFDFVVLSSALEPNDTTAELAIMMDLPLDNRGFFEGEHKLMKPVSTISEGVFLAGSCRGPVDVEDAIMQGSAAAGKILSKLIPGKKIELESVVSSIHEDLCGDCRLCYSDCSYGAISRNGNGAMQVNQILCRGCGHCAALCPSGVIELHHYTHAEILAEVDGILAGNKEHVVIAFLCQWCSYMAADNAGQLHAYYPWNIIPVKLRCIGNLDPQYVLRALQGGAEGVLILGCHPGSCHYRDGNYKALRKVTLLKKMLLQLGIRENRIYFGYASKSEGTRFAGICNDMIKNLKIPDMKT
jgi:heterodisulfide reductase subunit A2